MIIPKEKIKHVDYLTINVNGIGPGRKKWETRSWTWLRRKHTKEVKNDI